jgi:hypothetical protein
VALAADADLLHADYAQKVDSFLDQWIDCELGSVHPGSIPVQTVLQMSKLHQEIKFLVADFCSCAMKDFKDLKYGEGSSIHLSATETVRITRAFYRLELFCVLYRDRCLLGEIEDMEKGQYDVTKILAYRLFATWNAWENEEIACVRDYIYARLAEVFSYIQTEASVSPFKVILYEPWEPAPKYLPHGAVAMCDSLEPRWYRDDLECGVDLSPEGYLDEFQAMFLCQGIDCPSRLFSAVNPQQQVYIFLSKRDESAFSFDADSCFTRKLENTPYCMEMISRAREAFFHDDEEIFEGDDDAAGPNFAWAWAGGQKFQTYYASADRTHLRRWGYVMWDHQRLVESSACQNLTEPPDRFSRCESSIIERHNQICRRRLKEANGKDENIVHQSTTEEKSQDPAAEDDSENTGSERKSVVGEDFELQDEVNEYQDEDQWVAVSSTATSSGYSFENMSPLRLDFLDLSQAARNHIDEGEEGSQHVLAMSEMSFEGAVHAASETQESSIPSPE